MPRIRILIVLQYLPFCKQQETDSELANPDENGEQPRKKRQTVASKADNKSTVSAKKKNTGKGKGRR